MYYSYFIMKNIFLLKKRYSILYCNLTKKIILKNNYFKVKFKINNFFNIIIKKNKIILFSLINEISYLFNIFLLIIKLNLNKIYFHHLKIYGLGFRISIIDKNYLRIDFGWSHVVYFFIPKNITVLQKKSEFLFYSNSILELNNFIFLLTSFYQRSPYTLKGIFKIHQKIKIKIGKQRQK